MHYAVQVQGHEEWFWKSCRLWKAENFIISQNKCWRYFNRMLQMNCLDYVINVFSILSDQVTFHVDIDPIWKKNRDLVNSNCQFPFGDGDLMHITSPSLL